MNKSLLNYFMAKKGYNGGTISEALGINRATFSQKANGHAQFTQKEIANIIQMLELNETDAIDIFFSQEVS